jgi:hypothetical protein
MSTAEELFKDFPRQKILINGVEHEMVVLWQRDPEQDVWEPMMKDIADVLEKYIHDNMDDELRTYVKNYAIELRSDYTRIWDTYNAAEVIDRMHDVLYDMPEELQRFDTFVPELEPLTIKLQRYIDEVRVSKNLAKMYNVDN